MKKKVLAISGFILSLTFLGFFESFGANLVIAGNPSYMSPGDTLDNNSWLLVSPVDLEIVHPSNGISFYREGILFLSSTKYEKKMISNHLSFGRIDTRYATLNDQLIENPRSFSSSNPFTSPSDAISFGNDYNTMFYTKYSESEGLGRIYRADFSESNKKWNLNDRPLGFCSGNSNYLYPAISEDGKLMVFASDRPGSIGGMDLFVTLLKNGSWSEPVNLGEAVNTTGNEIYPYLDSQNNLYFSSDGIQGYGGYDIFICRFKSNTWDNPVNLSKPINTNLDDIAFTLRKKDAKLAFYTTRERYGRKDRTLHMVSLNRDIPDPEMTISNYFTSPDISHMVILALEPPVEATDKKTEEARLRDAETATGDISYRVQFMTSFNPRTRSEITVGGKDYEVFEYLYSGAYRLFVGEFRKLSDAVELQNLMKVNDYPRATVAAFRGNVLSLDPALLTGEIQPSTGKEENKPDKAEKVKAAEPTKKVKQEVEKEIAETKIHKADPAKKTEAIKTATIKEPEKPIDIIIYRIQILASPTAKGSYEITIAGKKYKTFEYLHAGAFRTTVGEFDNLTDARKLQTAARKAGYNQAFVIAFKNGKRSSDPELFR